MFKRKLMKNKLIALILILLGLITTYLDSDITFLVLTLLVGIPLFVSRKNWIS